VILLDTDVLLDVALDREPHVDASGALLAHVERRGRGGFVAWHTLSNFYYLVRPVRGQQDTRAFLVDLCSFVVVAPTDAHSLRYAASLSMADLEDAMQVAAARACGAGVIATRNVRDFDRSPTPARTPAEILAEGF
jgi:predicted nucleic acid-binding protein